MDFLWQLGQNVKRFEAKEEIEEVSRLDIFLKLANKHKQTIYYFNDIQVPGLHTIQYYNMYKTVVKMMIKIKTTKTIYKRILYTMWEDDS